ncbi:MAG TPA: bifunctional 4-hydroxy-2-oxoglutarate aldolase/2-dehydro-3-deoxy-phosphogluconate aldolase [Chryseolinea sp.]|nr:bifunctional 4-hydroxy-2-oxoglutarate aldolase/2-dehydro-3-deoxy-phosphogluconate aldolase [Chryseolinea sp.]
MIETLLTLPVVGIIRDKTPDEVMSILPLYAASGLTTVEITMNTPNAVSMIGEALKAHGGYLNIGAGTVCNMTDLTSALEAGAQFIVTPNLDEEVIRYCVQRQVPVFPGAYTPSEIYKAWSLGATMVKMFPANVLGTSYMKELKGPMGQIRLMATGGVNLDNCVDFFQAGASAVGIGSQLFDHNMIANRDWDGLMNHFKRFVKKMNTRDRMREPANNF